MESPVAAAITPAERGNPFEKPRATTGRTKLEEASEGLPLRAGNVSESMGKEGPYSEDLREISKSVSGRMRALPGRRPRKPTESAASFLRSMAGVLALAVAFAVAVSTLYRMVSCLQGALREKGRTIRSSGILSRRLRLAEEADDDPPPYEEAIHMPVVAAPVPLPPPRSDGRPPPS